MPISVDRAIESVLGDPVAPDEASASAVRDRARRVLRPQGALARLDEAAAWLAAWQRTEHPRVLEPALLLFAGDHGVVDRGVTSYPPDVTALVAKAVEVGVATSSVMARQIGASVRVVDVGVGLPTGDISRYPAMSEVRFLDAFESGRQEVAGLRTDLLVLGEMGIGNTTAAAAVCTALFRTPASEWTGRGSGIDDRTLALKIGVVEGAAQRVGHGSGPMEVLRQLGGCELAALAGALVEARTRSIPVVLDGFVVGAAAAALHALNDRSLQNCLAGHVSAEPGHPRLLKRLGLRPLLDLEMRLGEGTGALAAVPLLRLASASVTEVATLKEWGVQPA